MSEPVDRVELADMLEWLFSDLATRPTGSRNPEQPLRGLWLDYQRSSSRDRGKPGHRRGKTYIHGSDFSLRVYVAISVARRAGDSIAGALRRMAAVLDKTAPKPASIRVLYHRYRDPLRETYVDEWISYFRFWKKWVIASDDCTIERVAGQIQKEAGAQAAGRFCKLAVRIRRQAARTGA
jgi:hypothetical protein